MLSVLLLGMQQQMMWESKKMNSPHLLLLANIHNARQNLLVPKLREAHNGTATLDWLNDLGGLVAC